MRRDEENLGSKPHAHGRVAEASVFEGSTTTELTWVVTVYASRKGGAIGPFEQENRGAGASVRRLASADPADPRADDPVIVGARLPMRCHAQPAPVLASSRFLLLRFGSW